MNMKTNIDPYELSYRERDLDDEQRNAVSRRRREEDGCAAVRDGGDAAEREIVREGINVAAALPTERVCRRGFVKERE